MVLTKTLVLICFAVLGSQAPVVVSTVSLRQVRRQKLNSRPLATQERGLGQSDLLKLQIHGQDYKRMHIRVNKVHSRDTGTS